MVRLFLVAVFATLVGQGAPAQSARVGSGPSIAEVTHDGDGDRIPDALGQQVTVTGWASTDVGQLGEPGPSLYVQDETGGLAVVRLDGAPVRAGARVRLHGRLAFALGTPYLDAPRLEILDGPLAPPAPIPIVTGDLEGVEGQLVEVEGMVTGVSEVEAGEALTLSLTDRQVVVAFIFRGRRSDLSFARYAPGDRVVVTGIAGQFDRVAPFTEGYQVYPRTVADVRRAGFSPSLYRTASLVTIALLLVALGWAAVLRRQVGRRVAALHESESLYRQLVDRASDAVFLHDLVGRAFEGNRSARELLGVGEDDPLPRPIEAVAPEHHRRLVEHARALRDSGKARTDLLVCQGNGSQRLFEFESQTITLGGLPMVLSLGRDVDARRRYERGLVEAREQAEETARAKSAFLASMSHEIRTPLTAVIGFADLLREEVPDEQRPLVETIERGGRRLLATLNSVLDLARLDADRETLRPTPIDLVDYVGRGLELFTPLAGARGLTLDFEADVDRLPAVLDESAIDRILANLVGNAIKFTDVGGVVVRLTTHEGDGILTVQDTGIGMSEAFLPELFSEFRQESEGEARRHEGTGLGMAITKRLVGLVGGQIAVESARGQGTTFTVVLPLGVPGEPQRHEAALAAA